MKTAKEILSKYSINLDNQEREPVIEAMEEYAYQFSATVKVTECSFKSLCEQFDIESKKQFCGCFNSSSEVSKTDAIPICECGIPKRWFNSTSRYECSNPNCDKF